MLAQGDKMNDIESYQIWRWATGNRGPEVSHSREKYVKFMNIWDFSPNKGEKNNISRANIYIYLYAYIPQPLFSGIGGFQLCCYSGGPV